MDEDAVIIVVGAARQGPSLLTHVMCVLAPLSHHSDVVFACYVLQQLARPYSCSARRRVISWDEVQDAHSLR